jgi:hypothetical protein
VFSTPIPLCASTANIQGKNRVREQRSHGSVRGVSSNQHLYRDFAHKSARYFLVGAKHSSAAIFACQRKRSPWPELEIANCDLKFYISSLVSGNMKALLEFA